MHHDSSQPVCLHPELCGGFAIAMVFGPVTRRTMVRLNLQKAPVSPPTKDDRGKTVGTLLKKLNFACF
jgi:hypothetical protein